MSRDIIAMVVGQHFAGDNDTTYDDLIGLVNKIETAFNESNEPYASAFAWGYIVEHKIIPKEIGQNDKHI